MWELFLTRNPCRGGIMGEDRDLAEKEFESFPDVAADLINALYQFANQSGPDSRMVLRTAGYTGAVYREQYEGKSRGCCPVMDLVLYWGKKPWGNGGSIRRLFRKR